MVVLRCPYCGEHVRQGDQFCSHCGKQFDKPEIDEYSSFYQEGAGLVFKLIGLVILWFIILLFIGFVWHATGLPMNYGVSFVLSFVLTAIVVLFIKKKV